MSNSLNTPEADRLRALSRSIAELRATTYRLESLRDESIRELWNDGTYSAIELGKIVDATRGRIYQILDSPPPEADNHEHAEFARAFDQAMQWAIDEYVDSGREGSVDDFFPLDQMLRHRARAK